MFFAGKPFEVNRRYVIRKTRDCLRAVMQCNQESHVVVVFILRGGSKSNLTKYAPDVLNSYRIRPALCKHKESLISLMWQSLW